MIQEIITYLILTAAFGMTALKLFRLLLSFKKKKQEEAKTAGKCGSCSTGCALKDLAAEPECPTVPAKANYSL